MPTPCSTAIPAECGRIFEEIRSIQNEIQALQAELRRASPREKPAIIRQIRELTTTKRDREAAYASCANNPRPIALRFLGAMVMAFTNNSGRSQSAPGVDFVAHFTAQRDRLTIYSMADVVSNPYSALSRLNNYEAGQGGRARPNRPVEHGSLTQAGAAGGRRAACPPYFEGCPHDR